MRNVRQMVNRVERAGYSCQLRRRRDIPPRGDGPIRGRRGRLARHRHRARLLDGARTGSATRGTATAWWSPRSTTRTATVPRRLRRAVLRAVGHGRHLAGPDAPRPDRDPGLNELLIVAALAAARRAGHRAGLAELRDVPLGVRARRAARRRPGAAALARHAGVLLPLVPDRVAVQVQREVPAGVGAAVRGLPRHRDLPRIGFAALQAEAFIALELPARVRRWIPGLPDPAPPQARHPMRTRPADALNPDRPQGPGNCATSHDAPGGGPPAAAATAVVGPLARTG